MFYRMEHANVQKQRVVQTMNVRQKDQTTMLVRITLTYRYTNISIFLLIHIFIVIYNQLYYKRNDIFFDILDCVAVIPFDGSDGTGHWMDTACNQKRNFICEGNASKLINTN